MSAVVNGSGHEQSAYIGTRPACGCVVFVVVDHRDRDTGAAVARAIADGLTIEHVTIGHARRVLRVCDCRERQLSIEVPS